MEKALTLAGLASANIRRKPFRTAALLALIALSAAVLFGSLILVSSLKCGIKGIQSRIGADLMIVPDGYEAKMEGVLLSGQPSYFYMSKGIEDLVRNVEGVQLVTSQFYLTSLSESCCDFPIQIIGFDSNTDFIVKNWARKKVSASDSSTGEVLLAGSNISTEKNKVTFFAKKHEISARLEKSGTGMDNVIYADLPTLQKMFSDAKEKGFGFISDGDSTSKTSVIFVRLASGYKADGVTLRIKNALAASDFASEKIQVIQSESFLSTFVNKLSSFLIFIYANCILVFVIAVLTLAVVFSMSINERLREFSILRVLGTDHSGLRKIIFTEAAILGSLGAVIGIFVASLVIIPFNVIISEKIALPFAMASPVNIAIFAGIVFALSLCSCLVASVFSAVRISNFEIYGGAK